MGFVYTSLFKVMSEERRRRIISALQGHEFSVQELQAVLSLGQSIISAHLAQLKLNHLVGSRRQGKFILYRLANNEDEHCMDFLHSVLELASKEEWFERDQRKIQQVLNNKKEASLSFYEGVETQNKRSPGQTDHALSIAMVRGIRNKCIVDIGCGNGTLAKEFSRLNDTVIGIDIDENQIDLAKQLHGDDTSKVLRFMVSSAEALDIPDNFADMILFSHSLHHVDNPFNAIQESYRVLKSNGLLVILDLCAHNEAWLRNVYKDTHLGFEIDEVKQWLDDLGFKHVYIDLDSGDVDFPNFETMIVTTTKQ